MDYVEKRSRLTTFFRGITVIPHMIVLSLYGIAAFAAVVVAWFALLFTGRWPRGLYDFVAGYLRIQGRVNAYMLLGVDPYPSFGTGVEPSYPARVHVGEPLPAYSRLKVFFRGIYAIPTMIVNYALSLVAYGVAFVSWIVIVVTGKQPAGLQDALRFSLSYITRAGALMLLVTETYPPLSDPAAPPEPLRQT